MLLAVPFSTVGAIWSVYLLGYPMSPAVWVGLIALLGSGAGTVVRAYERYFPRTQIDAVEKSLGIEDLARFTPGA